MNGLIRKSRELILPEKQASKVEFKRSLLLLANLSAYFLHFFVTVWFFLNGGISRAGVGLLFLAFDVLVTFCVVKMKVKLGIGLTVCLWLSYALGMDLLLSGVNYSFLFLMYQAVFLAIIEPESRLSMWILAIGSVGILAYNLLFADFCTEKVIVLANVIFFAVFMFLILNYKRRFDLFRMRNKDSLIMYYRNQIVTDPLTNLYNRRYSDYIFEKLDCLNNKKITVALADIDNFKSVNDTYGHQAGDKVLVNVANSLSKNVKDGDFVIRWGGEEFLIVAIGDSFQENCKLFEELRKKTEKMSVYDDGTNSLISVTLTMGISGYKRYCFDETLRICDYKLYEGKRSGKNKIVV